MIRHHLAAICGQTLSEIAGPGTVGLFVVLLVLLMKHRRHFPYHREAVPLLVAWTSVVAVTPEWGGAWLFGRPAMDVVVTLLSCSWLLCLFGRALQRDPVGESRAIHGVPIVAASLAFLQLTVFADVELRHDLENGRHWPRDEETLQVLIAATYNATALAAFAFMTAVAIVSGSAISRLRGMADKGRDT